ncbi:MAG: MarR family winged helix-turn-helix transcriptional regulator [Eubacteriaceae bacterium]|jgi:DNA-binding MarR family transcriptional regulator
MKDCEQQLFRLYSGLVDMDQQSRETHSREEQADCFTPCQIRYLQLIDSYERLTSSQFARIMQVSKPTVSQLISRFVNSDCIYKEPSARDRRICYIMLTPKGQKIARADDEARHEVIRNIREKLTPEELDLLITLLNKLV